MQAIKTPSTVIIGDVVAHDTFKVINSIQDHLDRLNLIIL